jgi:hypothetical protein
MRHVILAMLVFVGGSGTAFAQTYCNSTPITIGPGAGVASPYPSPVVIAGAAGPISNLSVIFNGMTHTFTDDIGMLLVGPGGQKMVIQSNAGGSFDVNAGYVLSDHGSVALPDNALIGSGHYRPASYGGSTSFAAPAPVGPYDEAAPRGSATFASVFGGTNPNGSWQLYVVDDADLDAGSMAGGWCLSLNPAPPRLRITEFRVRGPSGANDEFIEVGNIGNSSVTVAAYNGTTGYAIAASDGVPRCVIPNGTVIPPGGHYLCANSVAYSLSAYPAGNGTTATADATYTTDIPDNAGIALFGVSNVPSFGLATRIDAVGSSSEGNTLYKEGTGYPALTPFSIDYAFYRDDCGKDGSITAIGPCTQHGIPSDTENNITDFVFVDTNGTSAGAGQRLGAPGPQNLSAPTASLTAIIASQPLDTCATAASVPNMVRDYTSDPAHNSTFGTLDLRRTFTNNTGVALTRLRFRVTDLTTFPAPSGISDLRPITSMDAFVTVNRPPCASGNSNVSVHGTTLEQPPAQPNGGGFNTSMSVALAPSLAAGQSIDVRFLFGIQQTGLFKVALLPEALPKGGKTEWYIVGCTEPGGCGLDDYIFQDSFNF